MKIRTQLILTGFVLIALSFGTFGVLLYRAERRFLLHQQRESLAEMTRAFATVCAEGSAVKDDLSIINYAQQLVRSPNVIAAQFERPTAKTLAATTPDPQRAHETPVTQTHPVFHSDRRVGTALILFSQPVLTRSVETLINQTAQRIVMSGAIPLGSGLLILLMLTHLLTRPLNALTRGASRIGDGTLTHRIDERGPREYRLLAREFNLMASKLHELDTIKQDFVATVTHELRHPINTIISYLNMFMSTAADRFSAQDRENFEKMRQEALRLSGDIDQMLQAARIERGKLTLHKTTVQLAPLVHTLIKEDFALQAEQKHITITAAIPAALALTADQELLTRVLKNLISNALKYTPRGGSIGVHAQSETAVSREHAGQNTLGHIHMTVSDTGVGIPREFLTRIFNKFEQAKHNKEKLYERVGKVSGIGLGLSICKEIVETHGGTIWVESEVNRGSTFHVLLPVK